MTDGVVPPVVETKGKDESGLALITEETVKINGALAVSAPSVIV